MDRTERLCIVMELLRSHQTTGVARHKPDTEFLK
jgi:hypothetical protein